MRFFVGFGNSGDKYVGNCYNIGFMVLDCIVEDYGFLFWCSKF